MIIERKVAINSTNNQQTTRAEIEAQNIYALFVGRYAVNIR